MAPLSVSDGRVSPERALLRLTLWGAKRRDRWKECRKETIMEARLNLVENPTAMKFVQHINSAGQTITDSSLPRATQELVKLRASQINGCGFCTDMHSKEAAHA